MFNLNTIPILQAPIGGASNPELCAAVSNAGGVGGLALTWKSPEDASQAVRDVHAKTGNPFFVNFALAFDPIGLEAVLAESPPVVTFSWGDPIRYVDKVKQAGAKLGIQVTSASGALYAAELGADFVILQGTEAGGHVQAHLSWEDNLSQVVAIGVPTFVAGGIASGVQIRRVLDRGAAGVVIGTSFLASRESGAHDEFKKRLTRAEGDDTVLTTCFVGDWPNAPHRVLRNSTFEAWDARGCGRVGERPGEGDVLGVSPSGYRIERYSEAMPLSGTEGNIEAMCLYAGVGVGAVQSIESAAEIVARLWSEATEGRR